MITPDFIRKGITERFRPFCSVESQELPDFAMPIIKSFWHATRLISAVLDFRYVVRVFIGVDPFTLNIQRQVMKLELSPETIAVNLHNFIFLDCNKLIGIEDPSRTAAILEEFVHAFMNVKDEDITSRFVAILFDEIQFINGKYVPSR